MAFEAYIPPERRKHLPEGIDLQFNLDSFTLGMPYQCCLCHEIKSPGDHQHGCKGEVDDEKVLASYLAAEEPSSATKILLRLRGVDIEGAMQAYANTGKPLLAVLISILFGEGLEKRHEWLDSCTFLSKNAIDELKRVPLVPRG